jgi:pilus assembly protein CpaB
VSVRRLLLFLGVFLVIAGLGLAGLWLNRIKIPASPVAVPPPTRSALLTAQHSIPAGTLLRDGDIGWTELAPGQIRPGQLLRGEISDTEFLGAITRREFAAGEALMASELVKPSDRRFLAAVLRPSKRAVSISVDAPQTASGLVLPGDSVDVILTQNFGDNVASATHRSAGETVLQGVRVVAVDQLLGPATKASSQPGAPGTESRTPKTVTLEVDARQAETLAVAMQLGKLHITVRPLEGSGTALAALPPARPTWASDVSLAIREMAAETAKPAPPVSKPKPAAKVSGQRSTGSTLETHMRFPPTTIVIEDDEEEVEPARRPTAVSEKAP